MLDSVVLCFPLRGEESRLDCLAMSAEFAAIGCARNDPKNYAEFAKAINEQSERLLTNSAD